MSAPLPFVYVQGLGTVPADWLNTAVQTVLNVAQLRTFSGLANMQILLLGTTTPGDGGAGPFYWSSGATAADNGTTIIRPNGTRIGAWLRLGYYNTQQSAGGAIYVSQLKQGLAIVDSNMVVASTIPANPYDSVTIGWTGAVMTVGSALYAFVQSTLNYTNSQMTAFFNTCSAYPVDP